MPSDAIFHEDCGIRVLVDHLADQKSEHLEERQDYYDVFESLIAVRLHSGKPSALTRAFLNAVVSILLFSFDYFLFPYARFIRSAQFGACNPCQGSSPPSFTSIFASSFSVNLTLSSFHCYTG